MDWLKETIHEIKCETNDIEHEQIYFAIKPINVETGIHPVHFDVLAQWVITPHLFAGINGITQIPIVTPESSEYLLRNAAVHFNRVRAVYVKDQIDMLYFEQLKEDSKVLFWQEIIETKKMNPVVYDLFLKYRDKDKKSMSKEDLRQRQIPRKEIMKMELILDKIIGNDNPKQWNNDEYAIWKYICSSAITKYKQFNLCPTGWKLHESLKISPALIFFSKYAEQVFLYTDKNSLEIVGISVM